MLFLGLSRNPRSRLRPSGYHGHGPGPDAVSFTPHTDVIWSNHDIDDPSLFIIKSSFFVVVSSSPCLLSYLRDPRLVFRSFLHISGSDVVVAAACIKVISGFQIQGASANIPFRKSQTPTTNSATTTETWGQWILTSYAISSLVRGVPASERPACSELTFGATWTHATSVQYPGGTWGNEKTAS